MYLLVRKKSIIAIFLCCLVVAAFVTGSVIFPKAVPSASTDSNWGLSFGEIGGQPRGNATAEDLRQYGAYYIGDAQKKKIYITFDAGFENGNTPAILDALKKHNITAAFFLVGNYIKMSPSLVKRMVDEGHIVGNHTYNHPDMSKISEADSFREEIESLEKLFKESTGKDMKKYYRPPQGKYSKKNLYMAHEMGYTTVFWSLAYVDWYTDDQPSREEAFEKLIPRIHPGAVVLLHSTSATNAKILDELLTRWKAEGYTFGSLDDLCGKKE